jgi:Protein of unknown function (DUF2786)
MTEDRDKLLARIGALMAKTVEAGCTDAEALAFAEKAHELIERYQIDLGAEEIKREGFVKNRIKMEPARFAFARRILLAINEFCEVRTWYTTFTGLAEITVFGLRSDAELASYLIDSLLRAPTCMSPSSASWRWAGHLFNRDRGELRSLARRGRCAQH